MYITDMMIIQCKMVVTKNCQPVYWTSHWRIFRHKSSLQPIFLFVPTRKWKSFHSLTKCEQHYVIVFNVAYQDVQTYFGRLYGEFYSEYFMEHSLCSVIRKMLITTYNEKKWINYGQRILLSVCFYFIQCLFFIQFIAFDTLIFSESSFLTFVWTNVLLHLEWI